MKRSIQRFVPVLAAISVAVLAGLMLAGSAAAQSSEIPVDPQTVESGPAKLYFWQEGNDPQTCEAQDLSGPQETDGETPSALCQLRVEQPTDESTENEAPREETRPIQGGTAPADAPSDVDETVLFALDTFSDEDDDLQSGPDEGPDTEFYNGSEVDWTIQPGSNALKTLFYYNTETACPGQGELPSDQSVDFTIRFLKGPETFARSSEPLSELTEIASTTENVCRTGGGSLSEDGAEQLTISAGIDSPVDVAENEVVVVQIAASVEEPLSGTQQWRVFFQDQNYQSRASIQTEAIVEGGVWAEDLTETQRASFSPAATGDDAYMIPNMQLWSPFGRDLVPADGWEVQIRDPGDGADSEFVDLLTDESGDTTVLEMDENRNQRSELGGIKSYTIENPSDNDHPWRYGLLNEEDIETGTHKLDVTDSDTGRSLDGEVAMGDFRFELDTVPGESRNHQVTDGSSSTFLIRLENRADRSDAFELSTRFDFSPSGQNWNIDLVGTGSTVQLAAGEAELVQVQVTPPDEAGPGDAARFKLEATSDSTSTTKNVSLEAQVTDDVIRDVGAFVLEDPQSVRTGETSTVTVYAWNRGTAPDSLDVNVLSDTFDPDNDRFDAEPGQTVFDSVSPGAVAGAPIEVTTTSDVRSGDRFNFSAEISSRNIDGETARALVTTIVEADRGFEVFAIDGDDTKALESERWGRFNRSQFLINPNREPCEPKNQGTDRPDECDDWTNVTYHRFTVKNTGTQAETFNLSKSPEDGRFTAIGDTGSNPCTQILEGRTDLDATGLIKSIDRQNPGQEDKISQLEIEARDTKHFYLRHVYDGHGRFDKGFGPNDLPCEREAFRTSVQVGLDDGETKAIDARTFFELENTNTVPDRARAEVRLEDRFEDEDTGKFIELPPFTSIEPGESTTIWFTASLQTGHEDQMNIRMLSQNRVQDLVDDGWEIRLIAQDVPVNRSGPREIKVPDDSRVGPESKGTIGHASGEDYTLGLNVTPPASGVQENARFSFGVEAASTEQPIEQSDIGIGVQIGEEFGFDLDSGPTQLIQAHPGDRVAFGLGIENTGATRDTFTVDTTSSLTGTDVSAQPNRLEVAPGFSKISSIAVNVSEGASTGTPIDVTSSVTADHGDQPDETLNETYTVEVLEKTGPISMTALNDGRANLGPGGQTAVDFEISNDAGSSTTVRLLELLAPPGWETTLTGTQNTTRTIDAGNSTMFSYLLEAPDTIVEGSLYTFMIRAENVADTSEFAVAPAQITAQGDEAVSLVAEEDEQVVDRGDSTSFPVLVQNPGTDTTTYRLRAQFASTGWDARFIDSNGTVLDDQTITVGEKQFNRRVQVEVSAPEDVSQGHTENLTMRAFAVGNQSVSSQVELSAQIHEYGVDVDVTSATTKDAAPGDNLEYEVTVTNTGNGEDRIRLGFEDPMGNQPEYPVTMNLEDQTTPTLAPGESLRNVSLSVQVDGPGDSPIPTESGVDTVIRATSVGDTSDTPPTASETVTSRLVPYEAIDIDDDNVLEMALDKNRDRSDGFEVFVDQDQNLIERGDIDRDQSTVSLGQYVLDGDGDDRIEHLVDADGDGLADAYFDPDRRKVYRVPYTVDATEDSQPEIPVDANFDGLIEGMYDPAADEVYETRNEFFSGDGQRDLLIDTDGDGVFDTFVDPNASPPVVTEANRDGDVYELDTDGDGNVDTHYNAQTQSITDAETANLQEFTTDYWYVLVAFLAVIVVFGVIVYRRV